MLDYDDAGSDPAKNVDGKYYEAIRAGGLGERLLVAARENIYRDFLVVTGARAGQPILDVGVSDVIQPGANVLERKYPHHADITACGIGSAPDFTTAFPDVRYIKIEAGKPLPFEADSFAISTANAVLEHVGSEANQRAFVAELARVAKRAFITVPNRFFPVEHHTNVPLLHYFDTTFGWACALSGKSKWAKAENLILMSVRRLRDLAPDGYSVRVGTTGIGMGPFSSNLFMALERRN